MSPDACHRRRADGQPGELGARTRRAAPDWLRLAANRFEQNGLGGRGRDGPSVAFWGRRTRGGATSELIDPGARVLRPFDDADAAVALQSSELYSRGVGEAVESQLFSQVVIAHVMAAHH